MRNNCSSSSRVSVIILSWNTKDLLRQCLKSLIETCRVDGDFEIIVVDNGSADKSPEMVEKEFPNVRLIRNRENRGFSQGNNQGLKIARGDYILLLNSDVIVQPKAVETLVNFLKRTGKNVGAVSPLLVNPDGTIQEQYYMKFPNIWQIFLYHNPLFRPIVMKSFLKKIVLEEIKGNDPRPMGQLPGTALMARKEVFRKVGYLDEDYRFLYEDVDWSYRARKMGYQLFLFPQAKIIHYGGSSWKKRKMKSPDGFNRHFFSSLLLFVRKNYGPRVFFWFRLAVAFNFFLRLKFSLAKYFLWTSAPTVKEDF